MNTFKTLALFSRISRDGLRTPSHGAPRRYRPVLLFRRDVAEQLGICVVFASAIELSANSLEGSIIR